MTHIGLIVTGKEALADFRIFVKPWKSGTQMQPFIFTPIL